MAKATAAMVGDIGEALAAVGLSELATTPGPPVDDGELDTKPEKSSQERKRKPKIKPQMK
jgi:hypothetical protein